MSASFDPNLGTPLDEMRLAVGDTDVADADTVLMADETYLGLLLQYGKNEAIARAAEALASRFGQTPDSVNSAGDAVTWRDRVKAWLALATSMRKAASDEAALLASTGSGTARTVAVQRSYEDPKSEYRRPEDTLWPG